MKNNHLIGLGLLLLSPVLMAAETPVGDKPNGIVDRAQFTSDVVDREPVDLMTVMENNQDQILFFTDIRQMSGRTVTHRWEYEGEVMAEIDFDVGGPRWRVHSSKTLLPTQLGKWTVIVVDQSGWPMHAEEFVYRQAVAMPAEPPVIEEAEVIEPVLEQPVSDSESTSKMSDSADNNMEIMESVVEEKVEMNEQLKAPVSEEAVQ